MADYIAIDYAKTLADWWKERSKLEREQIVAAAMSVPELANGHLAKDCFHSEQLLNPDAVSVKWFKCSKCGRTRKEYVEANQPVWNK